MNSAEARAGLTQGYIRSVVRPDEKRTTPNIEKAEIIANALGLDLVFLPRGEGLPAIEPITIGGNEFAAIPRVEAEASAGPGAINGEAEVVGSMAFRHDWLRARGVKPGKALLVKVTGNSMEPQIMTGDLVLLDMERTEIVNGQPYIFTDIDGETRLKRLHRLGERTLALVSDNMRDHPPELRTGLDAERVKVLGQVVWSGHNWG